MPSCIGASSYPPVCGSQRNDEGSRNNLRTSVLRYGFDGVTVLQGSARRWIMHSSSRTERTENKVKAERIAYRPREVAALTGLDTTSVCRAIAHGQIPYISVGRRVLVPRTSFERLFNDQAARN